MNKLIQDPFFIPKNNQKASADIVDLCNEVLNNLDQNKDEFERLSSQILDHYGESYGDAIIEDFDEFGPDSIEKLDPNGDFDSVIGGISEEGFEAIAFYKSFRFVNSHPARGRWGIFFIKPIISRLISEAAFDTGSSIDSAFEAVSRLVYVHELYHYKIDAFCLQTEAISSCATYIPYRNRVSILSMADWWEEAIANYYGLNAILKNSEKYQSDFKLIEYLKDMVKNSPGAYAYGINTSKQGHYRKRLSEQLNVSTVPALFRGPRGQLSPPTLALLTTLIGMKLERPRDRVLSGRLGLVNCPVYWITPPSIMGIKPPFLQAISLSEVEKLFIPKYLNGNKSRKTDHQFFVIDNGSEIKLPNGHLKDLQRHEYKDILRKSGLTSSYFFKERKRTNIWKNEVPRNLILPSRD